MFSSDSSFPTKREFCNLRSRCKNFRTGRDLKHSPLLASLKVLLHSTLSDLFDRTCNSRSTRSLNLSPLDGRLAKRGESSLAFAEFHRRSIQCNLMAIERKLFDCSTSRRRRSWKRVVCLGRSGETPFPPASFPSAARKPRARAFCKDSYDHN